MSLGVTTEERGVLVQPCRGVRCSFWCSCCKSVSSIIFLLWHSQQSSEKDSQSQVLQSPSTDLCVHLTSFQIYEKSSGCLEGAEPPASQLGSKHDLNLLYRGSPGQLARFTTEKWLGNSYSAPHRALTNSYEISFSKSF